MCARVCRSTLAHACTHPHGAWQARARTYQHSLCAGCCAYTYMYGCIQGTHRAYAWLLVHVTMRSSTYTGTSVIHPGYLHAYTNITRAWVCTLTNCKGAYMGTRTRPCMGGHAREPTQAHSCSSYACTHLCVPIHVWLCSCGTRRGYLSVHVKGNHVHSHTWGIIGTQMCAYVAYTCHIHMCVRT